MNEKSIPGRLYDKLTNLLEASYWNRPFRWLTFLAISLLMLVGIYLYLHSKNSFLLKERYGWETIQLRPARIQTLNYIFLNRPVVTSPDAVTNAPEAMTDVVTGQTPAEDQVELAGEYLINELGSGIFDSTYSAKTGSVKNKAPNVAIQIGSLDTVQLHHIKKILRRLPVEVCVSFLLEQHFRVRSYFWLIGGPAYWEVIFWSMFGVLASLLYAVSTATREENTESSYKPTDIAYQFAKLLYAPLATLVIIFAYHIIGSDNNSMVDIEAGKGMLFFSFIAGFYSGRLMMFLERLKDILLPFDSAKPQSEPKTTPKPEPTPNDVVVAVRVNPTAIDSEKLSDINEKFLDRTTLTLTRDGVVVHQFEKNEGDQEGDFIARQVKPGTYLLRASLSIPVTEGAVAQTLDPLAVAGDDTQHDLTTFSAEKTIEIGTDPGSRNVEVTLNPDESQG